MKNIYKKYGIFLALLFLVLMVVAVQKSNAASFALPACTPPGCNTPAPINVGTSTQSAQGISGGLSVDSMAVFGSFLIGGSLGISTSSVASLPATGLLVDGSVLAKQFCTLGGTCITSASLTSLTTGGNYWATTTTSGNPTLIKLYNTNNSVVMIGTTTNVSTVTGTKLVVDGNINAKNVCDLGGSSCVSPNKGKVIMVDGFKGGSGNNLIPLLFTRNNGAQGITNYYLATSSILARARINAADADFLIVHTSYSFTGGSEGVYYFAEIGYSQNDIFNMSRTPYFKAPFTHSYNSSITSGEFNQVVYIDKTNDPNGGEFAMFCGVRRPSGANVASSGDLSCFNYIVGYIHN